jgi:hypothetical protein
MPDAPPTGRCEGPATWSLAVVAPCRPAFESTATAQAVVDANGIDSDDPVGTLLSGVRNPIHSTSAGHTRARVGPAVPPVVHRAGQQVSDRNHGAAGRISADGRLRPAVAGVACHLGCPDARLIRPAVSPRPGWPAPRCARPARQRLTPDRTGSRTHRTPGTPGAALSAPPWGGSGGEECCGPDALHFCERSARMLVHVIGDHGVASFSRENRL